MSVKQRLMVAALSLSVIGASGIVAFEGMRKVAYVDPVGVVTVCAGHTVTAKLGQVKTDAECAELLKLDADYAEKAIKRLVRVPITQTQFDGLVSFVFNVGESNFSKSALLRKINASDCWGAGKEFRKWVYAGGRVLPGLVTRRNAERKQWESDCAQVNYGSASSRGTYLVEWVQARRPEYHAFALLV